MAVTGIKRLMRFLKRLTRREFYGKVVIQFEGGVPQHVEEQPSPKKYDTKELPG